MSSITKPIFLDETARDQAAALWAIAHTLRGNTAYTYDQVLDIIASGGGKKMFPVGTTLNVVNKNDNTIVYPFVFVHHGQHSDGRFYAHVRLMRADFLLQFDSPEAFHFAESGLAAGNYNVQLTAAYGQTAAGYYNFTLANAVPADGQLCGFVNASNADADGTNVSVYASSTATTASETAAMTRSNTAVGTTIGVLAAGGDDNNPNMNSLQRAAYGSNNYAQSASRQLINSAAAAGSVWAPQHKFDRPPTWAATQAGLLSLLPDEFLAIVNPIEIKTITNNVFEVDYAKNSSYTLTDKFWLPSRYQIFGTTEGSDLHEEQWDYYKNATDVDRIMYDAGGTARHQFLRSPYPTLAGSVRHVDSSGVLSYRNANYGHAEAPACEISLRAS